MAYQRNESLSECDVLHAILQLQTVERNGRKSCKGEGAIATGLA